VISKEEQPLITVVIPTYRRPKVLRRAIQSVLNQTYTNFRLTIYDNASGDETSEVVGAISKEDSRVVYHCHAQNIGAINNFNFGMRQVNTPYFSLLGDDNYLLPEFFEAAVYHLNGHSEKTIFVGQVENVDEQGRFMSRNLENWPSGLVRAPNGIIHLVESGFPNWEGILFRRQLIAKDGVLDPSFSGAADQEFIGRIARDYDFYVSKKVCAKFTHHSESWTSNRALSEYMGNMNRLLERWLQEVSWTAEEQKRLRSAVNRSIEGALRGYVIKNAIIGDDLGTLNTANQFVKNTQELSNKTITIVKVANLVNTNPVLKWTATLFAKLHLMKYHIRLSSK